MRKTFNDFITEAKKSVKTGNTPEEDFVEKYGKPGLVSQGGHSVRKRPQAFDTEKYGNPVLISQGGHSKDRDSLNEAFYPYETMKKSIDEYGWTNQSFRTRSELPTGTAAQIGAAREMKRVNKNLPGSGYSQDILGMFTDNHGRHAFNSHWGEGDIYAQHKNLESHYDYQNTPHKRELARYTDNSSDLNGTLYRRHLENPTEVPQYTPDDYIMSHNPHNLDIALAHHQLAEPLTVWTGLKWDPATQMSQSGRVFLPAYTSTSIDPSIAHSFTRSIVRGQQGEKPSSFSRDNPYGPSSDLHMLQIELPRGHGGMYLGTRSSFDSEKEFLMPRRTVLQLSKAPIMTRDFSYPEEHPVYGFYNKKQRLHIWHARPIKVD